MLSGQQVCTKWGRGEQYQAMTQEALTSVGIALCLSQSAMFSGLTLAVFSVSRLQLEVEAAGGKASARKVLALRDDSNFVLTTLLWGNVGINVLLTLLADSTLAGVSAFVFSTFVITIFGEIMPQAYFSRHALTVAYLLSPVLRIYQILLYPVVKPSALLLDAWLGKEAISYFREADLKEVIRRHVVAEDSEVSRIEGIGALNFLTIDDMPVRQEGVPLDPLSIIRLPVHDGRPLFPAFECSPDDSFLQRIHASGKSWVVIANESGEPHVMMDANGFLRDALLSGARPDPQRYCHRPVIIRDPEEPLGAAMARLRRDTETTDDLLEYDTILMWTKSPRVITGSDLLGRLLRGITKTHRDQ